MWFSLPELQLSQAKGTKTNVYTRTDNSLCDFAFVSVSFSRIVYLFWATAVYWGGQAWKSYPYQITYHLYSVPGNQLFWASVLWLQRLSSEYIDSKCLSCFLFHDALRGLQELLQHEMLHPSERLCQTSPPLFSYRACCSLQCFVFFPHGPFNNLKSMYFA